MEIFDDKEKYKAVEQVLESQNFKLFNTTKDVQKNIEILKKQIFEQEVPK